VKNERSFILKNLTVFKNEQFGEVRTIEENGKILFCGSDCARALGYAKPNDAVQRHCRATVKRGSRISGKVQEINFITEGDLYRLITHSKLPSAEKFESWVFDEVLPSIRKTGSYVTTLKQVQNERIHIMEMNARSRMAQMYLKLANVDTLSETYKTVLVSKASEVLAGEPILPLPLSKNSKVYSAREIGNIFGISANRVGRIANQYSLKTSEYGEYRRDKSQYSTKEVDVWVYFESVLSEFRRILAVGVA
jgi:prophage antirepressor-like protein